MNLPWYTTVEVVKDALDVKLTARMDRLIRDAVDAASRDIDDNQCNRVFYPLTATRSWDWPNDQYARPWRLWLDQHELISLTSLTSGGVAIPASAYLLEPNRSGPPYTRIDINLASASGFSGGSTYQRSIVAAGEWGFRADTQPAGALAEALDAVETAVDVTDSASIGIGDLIICESERMIVTGKALLSTGQSLQAPVTASMADTLLAVTSGAAFVADETLLLDAERMRVDDIAANTLLVRRAWDGTVLAAHTAPTIYAPRTLTVERGALGSTAATHLNATPLTRHVPPPLIHELATAEAINTVAQKASGYVRTVGSGDNVRNASGAGLADLRARAYAAHGRKARARAV